MSFKIMHNDESKENTTLENIIRDQTYSDMKLGFLSILICEDMVDL